MTDIIQEIANNIKTDWEIDETLIGEIGIYSGSDQDSDLIAVVKKENAYNEQLDHSVNAKLISMAPEMYKLLLDIQQTLSDENGQQKVFDINKLFNKIAE